MKISKRQTKLFIESEELRLKNQENYSELDMCLLQLFRSNKKDLKNRWKISELLSYMRKLRDQGEKFKRNHSLYSLLIGDFTALKNSENELNTIFKHPDTIQKPDLCLDYFALLDEKTKFEYFDGLIDERNNPSILFVLSLLTNDLNVIKIVVINADQFDFGIKYYMFLLNLLYDNKLYNSLEFLIKNYGISLTLIEDINRKF